MKILFLGGTRFFGPLIIADLLKKKNQITVVTRGALPDQLNGKVEHLRFDRTDAGQVVKYLSARSFDVVIDNVAYTDTHIKPLLPYILEWNARYILTSTALVYWCSDKKNPFSEDDVAWHRVDEFSVKPEHSYTYGKLLCEKVVWKEPNLRLVVVRPPIVWGPNDYTLRVYFYIQRLLDGGPLLLTGPTGSVHSFAFSEDLARFYSFLVDAPEALVERRAFNFAQPETLSTEDLSILLAGAGVKSRLVRTNTESLSFDYKEPLLDPAIYHQNIERTKTLFNSFTPAEKWLKATMDWYKQNPPEQNSLGYQNRTLEIENAKKIKLA